MDDVTWAALTIVLTVLGVFWTVIAFRRRGAANGLRALGLTLLPGAAWLTGTLRMFTEIGGSVSRWATSLVFDPRVWTGVGLAGAAALLLVVSGYIRDRQLGRAQQPGALPGGATPTGSSAPRSGTGAAPAAPSSGDRSARRGKQQTGDDDMDEIEELLKKRGIQ